MKVSAITLARFVAFVEPVDLNPRGHIYLPEMIPALVARYGFLKVPEKLEDFDESKGVKFEAGRIGNVTIQSLQLFTQAIVVETASSTTDSERVLVEALEWGADNFGLVYRPGMITRRGYVSQLTFHSDAIMGKIHPGLWRLSERLTRRVQQFAGQSLTYQPSQIVIMCDPLTAKNPTAPFTIERRAETPYAENKYFSTAPLPTEEHVSFLEALEADMLSA